MNTHRILWGGVILGGTYAYLLDVFTWPWASPMLCIALVAAVVAATHWLERQDPYQLRTDRWP